MRTSTGSLGWIWPEARRFRISSRAAAREVRGPSGEMWRVAAWAWEIARRSVRGANWSFTGSILSWGSSGNTLSPVGRLVEGEEKGLGAAHGLFCPWELLVSGSRPCCATRARPLASLGALE